MNTKVFHSLATAAICVALSVFLIGFYKAWLLFIPLIPALGCILYATVKLDISADSEQVWPEKAITMEGSEWPENPATLPKTFTGDLVDLNDNKYEI